MTFQPSKFWYWYGVVFSAYCGALFVNDVVHFRWIWAVVMFACCVINMWLASKRNPYTQPE